MVEGKTLNVYLGSCKKMSREEALERARWRKGEALGIEWISDSQSEIRKQHP
jgi:hypothetical protein